MVQVVVEVFEDFAMHVNFKKGKREALVFFRGSGAIKCKASIVDPNGSRSLFIPLVHGRLINLCVADSYKHLGSHVTADGNLVPEANHRVEAASGAYAPISFKILGNPSMSIERKLKLAW